MELRQQALQVLALADPQAKADAALALAAARPAPEPALDLAGCTAEQLPLLAAIPGRPPRPLLVPPEQVPRRRATTAAGRAALLHAIAHIEFNAINLALDAVWRFAGLPEAFYVDWLRVAGEEAQHFLLLRDHLRTLGHDYGDFDAHDGLWTMAERTKHDFTARMALVPRTMEARGLDATPPIQAKLAKAGDERAVAILDVVLRDEVGHVAIGNRWYAFACAREGLDPVAHYAVLTERHRAPRLKPPFNLSARRSAGFSEAELDFLAHGG
jgi:uncharacterized ferritin-like protein (DUF455 family)